VGPDGLVYVAGHVEQQDSGLRFQRHLPPTVQGDFFGPRGIATDGPGHIWVADTGNNRLIRFSVTARGSWLSHRPRTARRLAEPSGIAVDERNRVLVCDNDNGRLVVFDTDGTYLRAFPVPGWRREVYSEPHVAVDGHGAIGSPCRLKARSGPTPRKVRFLHSLATGTTLGVGLRRPCGILLQSKDGPILVSDIEGQLISLEKPRHDRGGNRSNQSGTALSTAGSSGAPYSSQDWDSSQLASGSFGRTFVSTGSRLALVGMALAAVAVWLMSPRPDTETPAPPHLATWERGSSPRPFWRRACCASSRSIAGRPAGSSMRPRTFS